MQVRTYSLFECVSITVHFYSIRTVAFVWLAGLTIHKLPVFATYCTDRTTFSMAVLFVGLFKIYDGTVAFKYLLDHALYY